MDSDRWRRLEQVYDAALTRAPSDRSRYLAEACADDPLLRAEVESLLAQEPVAKDFLEVPAFEAAARTLADEPEALPAGTRVGGYEIQARLGVGGMGQVYRARDARLGRDVAIKVLSPLLLPDRESRVRFSREARLLASVNHPNIAAIYGVEEIDGNLALVLELVEGPSLADWMRDTPRRSVRESLAIARHVAEGLEAAHAKGIVHRDLKPANIRLTVDGAVKIIDFGIAKSTTSDADPAASSSAASATGLGTVIGTAAYMSPEQARGQQTDKRTDIWAFGCLLYELLCRTPAFTRATTPDTIAAVLDTEPDWSRLPADTPIAVTRLLQRSLRKDLAHRLHDIADARIEIDDAHEPSSADRVSTRSPRGRGLIASALVLALTIATAQTVRLWRRSPAPLPVAAEARFEIAGPVEFAQQQQPASLAVSPDGLKMVYSASVNGRAQLWLRPIASATARPLAGTDGAVRPFWSPDSRSVGFFADSQLKRIDIDGGTVRSLARASFGVGGAWNSDGTILFTPIFSGPIFRITATGGEATPLTQLAAGQVLHLPMQFLADGRRFLYAAIGSPDTDGIYIGDLDGSQPKHIGAGQVAVLHPSSSRLFFVRQGILFSQALDPAALSLTGEPALVAEQVASVSASGAGPIAYRMRPLPARQQVVWFDRSGKELSRVGNPDDVRSGDANLSPDGRYLSLSRVLDGNPDLWLLDTARGVLTRFTSEQPSNWSLRWSPDGKRVAFDSARNGVGDLYVKSSSGAGTDELLLSTPQNKSPSDWSPDGRFLLYRTVDPVTSHDLWALPLDGDRQPFPVVRTNFVEALGQFSPDGHWIAYQSNESGQFEVYAQPFPGPGPKLRISTNGGGQMRWRGDGRELFYLGLDSRMMAVPIRPRENGQRLEAGTPVPLFTARVGTIVPLQSGYNLSYDVSPDGQRFLVNTVLDDTVAAPITVILNWNPGR